MTKLKANQVEIEEILNDPEAFANETKKGSVEIATQAEVDAGTGGVLVATAATVFNRPSDILDMTAFSDGTTDSLTSTKENFLLGSGTTGLSINTLAGVETGFNILNMSSPTIIAVDSWDESGSGTGFIIKDDGTQIWFCHSGGGGNIYTAPLVTPFDLSTITLPPTAIQVGTDNFLNITMNPTGTILMIQTTANAIIKQYDLGVAWDLTTATFTQTGPDIFNPGTDTDSMQFSRDGLHGYAGDRSRITYSFTLSSAWDISTATKDAFELDMSAHSTSGWNMYVSISEDGTQFFHHSFATPINEWTVATPFDLSTATWFQSASFGGTAPRRGVWSEGGLNYYVTGDDDLMHYTTGFGDGGTGETSTSLYYDGVATLTTSTVGVAVTGILNFAVEGSPATTPQIVLPNYTTVLLPATTFEGGIVYDSTTKGLKFYNNTSWTPILTNPLSSDLDTGGFTIITADSATPALLALKAGDQTVAGTGGLVSIRGGDGTVGAGDNGGEVLLVGGTAKSQAGKVRIFGGDAQANYGGSGGDITIGGGYGYNPSFQSGTVTVQGTYHVTRAGRLTLSGGSGAGLAGVINMEAGWSYTSENGGDTNILGGSAYAAGKRGGDIELKAGRGYGSADGGDIRILASYGASDSAGNVEIEAGNSGGATGVGGDITLTTGYGDSTNGSVIIHAPDNRTGAGKIAFRNDTATNHLTGFAVTLEASTSLATNVTLTLPITDGNSGEALVTDGGGILSWAAFSSTSHNHDADYVELTGDTMTGTLAIGSGTRKMAFRAGAPTVSFNRNPDTGVIYDSTYNAFVLNQVGTGDTATLDLTSYNTAGTIQKTHTFNMDGTVILRGDLTVASSNQSAIYTQAITDDTGAPQFTIKDVAGNKRGLFYKNINELYLERRSAAAVTETRLQLTSDGNVALTGNGAVPTADDHLTRRDYVDDNDRLTINAQLASYTLVLGDENALVTMSNGAANTLTIPTNASVAFPIGTQILVEQEGTGATTIAGTGSPPVPTIHSAGSLYTTASQYTAVTLIKKATDIWLIVGDLV